MRLWWKERRGLAPISTRPKIGPCWPLPQTWKIPHIDAPEDRAEGEVPDDPQMHFSADPDARWVKKGSKSTLGHKAFARAEEEGFVDRIHTKPANCAESPEFEHMIVGAKARRVLADKAYASRANRATLRGKHRDGIMRKAAAPPPISIICSWIASTSSRASQFGSLICWQAQR